MGTHQQDNRRRDNPSRPDERGNTPIDRKITRVQAPNEMARQTKMEKRIFKLVRTPLTSNTIYWGHEHVFFIHKHELLKGNKVTCSRIVCNIRPQKTKTHRVRLTVGGIKLSYKGPVSNPTADFITARLHWNKVLYTLDNK